MPLAETTIGNGTNCESSGQTGNGERKVRNPPTTAIVSSRCPPAPRRDRVLAFRFGPQCPGRSGPIGPHENTDGCTFNSDTQNYANLDTYPHGNCIRDGYADRQIFGYSDMDPDGNTYRHPDRNSHRYTPGYPNRHTDERTD